MYRARYARARSPLVLFVPATVLLLLLLLLLMLMVMSMLVLMLMMMMIGMLVLVVMIMRLLQRWPESMFTCHLSHTPPCLIPVVFRSFGVGVPATNPI